MLPIVQTAFPFDASTLAALHAEPHPQGFEAVGFEIGWDHARHRLTPPADHLHGGHPVRQGWDAARELFGRRTLQPSLAVRQWLDLRLQAWLRGRDFEDFAVTPAYLARIAADHCPVTREPLTHGTGAPTDATVVRLVDAAAVAAGHLAVMSHRAAAAKGQCTAAEALSVARRLDAGAIESAGGLDAAQWHRLASLLGFVTAQRHGEIASLPLRALPSPRLRVLNPVHALQTLLTLLFTEGAYARRMCELSALMPNGEARRAFGLFMNAMLARRLALGWTADRAQVRFALEDAWAHPVVARRWEQLALRLSRQDCERLVRLAAARRLGGRQWRWVDDAAATDGWALETRGCVGQQLGSMTVGGRATTRTTDQRQPPAPLTPPAADVTEAAAATA